ncbi:MAG: DUF2283 domain-containing protein [Promethearchaeota archaeon]
MKIKYNPKEDALYIELSNQPIDDSDELGKFLVIKYDKNHEPVGIELLQASRLFDGKREVNIELSLTESSKT